MVIPDDLTLSQASLQDYVECSYRFRLRYLERLEWPAVEAEPAGLNENRRRAGAEFHRMVHQYLLGVPAERLRELAEYRSQLGDDDDLTDWWNAFCEHRPAELPGERYPEVMLAAPVAGHRIAAKFDLVVVEQGRRAVILDWKTASRRPSAAKVERRLQTRVYQYLLALAGSVLNGGEPLVPEQIEMRYWFASFPTQMTVVRYDSERFDADAELVAGLLREISDRPIDDFERTEDRRQCQLCTYRSLCSREGGAGNGHPDESWIEEDQAQAVAVLSSLEEGDDTIEIEYGAVEEVPF